MKRRIRLWLYGILGIGAVLISIPMFMLGHSLGLISSPSCILGKIQGIPSNTLPELYPKIQWNQPIKRELGFYTLHFWEGYRVYPEGYEIKSLGIENYPSDFFNYYKGELGKRCWIKIDRFEGPGGVGYAYATKNGHHLYFGVLNPSPSSHYS